MIEREQAISFEVLSIRRDFRNTAKGEKFSVELVASEDAWGELRSFPRDAIGAATIKWPEECRSVSVGIIGGFYRRHKNRDESGEIFFLQIPITYTDWIKLGDYLDTGVGVAAAVWLRRASETVTEKAATKKRTAKPKPEKGPHGQLWNRLHSFHNKPDVRVWLGLPEVGNFEQEAINRLYNIFGVTSRSFISPDALIQKLEQGKAEGFNLDGALSAVEDARKRVMRLVESEAA